MRNPPKRAWRYTEEGLEAAFPQFSREGRIIRMALAVCESIGISYEPRLTTCSVWSPRRKAAMHFDALLRDYGCTSHDMYLTLLCTDDILSNAVQFGDRTIEIPGLNKTAERAAHARELLAIVNAPASKLGRDMLQRLDALEGKRAPVLHTSELHLA
jgi:hypothetical protein